MPDAPDPQPDPVEKSLGDQATGADASQVDRELSLGDQSTTGDALSSLSDLGSDLGEAIDSDLPLIDLAARYEIEGELGQGGMGAVLLATDRQLKRKVAIKRILGSMSKSKTALQRFVTEAQSIAKLNHFNIVQVHEFGRDAEGPFLVLEYVGGGSLLDKLKNGKLEVEEAVDITCQLCDALGKAHGAGIIHRDIKPANILLTEDGAPKLTDFGLARQDTADHGQTQTGAVLGTIDFMPPEQRRDATAADARSDLWSLAATLYQMLTGEVPRVIDLDTVPQSLRSTFTKALKQTPDERYATAEEFKSELRKGMATVATTVAADLAAGVCPACNTANDASRKFCRGCGESLELECLACSKGMPVWENFCGQCGTSQQEERDQVRKKLTDTLEASLTLAREHEYEKALSQLSSAQKDQHAFTEDIRQAAAKHIEMITTQRDEQYQLRDQLVELAAQHQQAHDYGAVVRELEKIPVPLRTWNKLTGQLINARGARDELASLEAEIRDDVKNKRVDGLLEKTTRFLELNPGHEKILKLHEELLQRQAKADSRVTQLLNKARQQYEQGEDEAVLATLANWPAALEQLARAAELREKATERQAHVQDLKARIAATTTAAAKLPLVQQLLTLRPNDKQARQLAAQLRQQVEAKKLQREELVKQRQRQKKMIIAASVVAASLLAGLWILSGRRETAATIAAALEKKDWRRVLQLDPTNSEALRLKEAATLNGHTYSVRTGAFSPDSKLIVSGSNDTTLIIWDAESGQQLLTLPGHTDGVLSVAFSPDGKWIVSGSEDQTLRIWDAKTGQQLQALEGHTSFVWSVAFSPDSKRIVSGSMDKTLRIWDAADGRTLRTLEGHTDGVRSVAFSPDGNRIVSGSNDTTLIIWDAESGQQLLTLPGHTDGVLSVAFSPDSKRIVSGSGDKTVRLWDASTGKRLGTLAGHTKSVLSVAYSPVGNTIASGSSDRTIRLWDVGSGKELQTLKEHTSRVLSVAFSPDSKRIVSGSMDTTLKIWPVSSLKP